MSYDRLCQRYRLMQRIHVLTDWQDGTALSVSANIPCKTIDSLDP